MGSKEGAGWTHCEFWCYIIIAALKTRVLCLQNKHSTGSTNICFLHTSLVITLLDRVGELPLRQHVLVNGVWDCRTWGWSSLAETPLQSLWNYSNLQWLTIDPRGLILFLVILLNCCRWVWVVELSICNEDTTLPCKIRKGVRGTVTEGD